MFRLALVPGLLVSLAACGSDPAVNETNASVEEVSEKVRQASRERGLLRAGKWESIVTIEDVSIPGAPVGAAEQMRSMVGQSRTGQVCLTEEQAAKPSEDFFAASENCRYDQFTMAGGKIDAAMRCTHEGIVQVMEMTGTYSSTSYEMRMRSSTQGGGDGQSMTMQMKVDAQRVGECDPAQQG